MGIQGEMIRIIVAVSNNNAIGAGGNLLHHLRGDLRRFKELTSGNTVVMGRKTYDSLPNGALPDRINIVLSRRNDLVLPDAIVTHDISEIRHLSKGTIFIIGGAEIYRLFLPIADSLEVTEIDADDSMADTFFPVIDPKLWAVTDQSQWYTDEKSGVRYRFVSYTRKH